MKKLLIQLALIDLVLIKSVDYKLINHVY